jgi:GTP:adenosylcobinamide-phosphate guanylyltransferase
MMHEPTLVIMAAGMGSRFGGLKQITPVDEQGHKIIDFSLFDAYRAGFRKVAFIIKHEIEEAADPAAKRAEKIAEYEEKFSNPYRAAERGYVDDVIEPALSRRYIISAFDMLASKRDSLPAKKHGNLPL